MAQEKTAQDNKEIKPKVQINVKQPFSFSFKKLQKPTRWMLGFLAGYMLFQFAYYPKVKDVQWEENYRASEILIESRLKKSSEDRNES